MQSGGTDRPAVWVVCARKGGVGKTTLVGHLATLYGENGLRVTLVDLDPQASLTSWVHPGGKVDGDILGAALKAGGNLAGLVRPSTLEGVHIIPSGEELTLNESELAAAPMGVVKVRDSLRTLLETDAELVLVDTPPHLAATVFGALAAADFALVPCPCEPMGVDAVGSTLGAIAEARNLNPGLQLLGVVPCRLDRRTGHGIAALDALRTALADDVTETVIPASAALCATAATRTVPDKSSPGWRAVFDLGAELAERMESMQGAQCVPSAGSMRSTRSPRSTDPMQSTEGAQAMHPRQSTGSTESMRSMQQE